MKRGSDSCLILYDFQKIGVSSILNGWNINVVVDKDKYPTNTKSFLLYDEMGLGKTIQAFEALAQNIEMNNVKLPTLVVCPAALIHIWTGDDYIQYFKDKFPRIYVFSSKSSSVDFNEYDIVIISYAMLSKAFRKHISWSPESNIDKQKLFKLCNEKKQSKIMYDVKKSSYQDLIFNRQWGHLIIDEIHSIKSPSSVKTLAVGFLNARYRLGLSGTPIMNHGGEMICILKFGLGLFDTINWAWIKKNPNSQYCKDMLRQLTLGRTKQDIGFKKATTLDDETIIIPWYEHLNIRKQYQDVKIGSLNTVQQIKELFQFFNESDVDFKKRKNKIIRVFLQKLHQLRQLCLKPKLDMFYEIYKNASDNNKIVVFSSYKKFFVEIMSPWLVEKKVNHEIFCGGSKAKQKYALEQFKTNDEIRVLLVVKSAGALGLNLQKTSSIVIILEPYFNSALDSQATHRVDRIGQEKNVTIKRLIMEGSVEVALLNMQKEKEILIKSWLINKNRNNENLTFNITSMHLKKYDTV